MLPRRQTLQGPHVPEKTLASTASYGRYFHACAASLRGVSAGALRTVQKWQVVPGHYQRRRKKPALVKAAQPAEQTTRSMKSQASVLITQKQRD
jgi:hypothetical protein